MTSSARGVERSDLVRIHWPLEPAIRPDGEQIVYIVSGPDSESDRVRYRLFTFDRASGETVAAVSVDDLRSPQWSPDGNQLACLAGGVVALVDATGDISRLSGSPRGARSYAWSPIGDRMAIVAAGWPQPMQSNLVEVVDIAAMRPAIPDELSVVTVDGDVQQVPVAGLSDLQHLAWSPGGEAVAFCGRSPGESGPAQALSLFSYDFAAGTLTELVPAIGPIKALAWAPDGAHIAFVGHRSGASHSANLELFVVAAAAGATPRSLSEPLDRSVGQVVRGDDERGVGATDLTWNEHGVLVLCAFGGSSTLLRFDLDGGWEQVIGGDRAILAFAVCSETGEIVFSWSDHRTPGELSVCSGAGGAERQCSVVNQQWRSSVALATTSAVSATASDGVELQGWLTVPLAPQKPVPLVLQVHGGPHYPVGNRFSFDAQRLAARGIAVLRANPRGAQGYGIGFATGIHGDWGGRDFADLMTLVDEVAALPEIDENRVAIVGESYGGYMVNWALANSDRFVAGIAENGIAFLPGVATGLAGVDYWNEEMGGPAWEQLDNLTSSSPLPRVAAITAPLLLIHAADDSTVPVGQSEAMFVALKTLGRDVSFYRIPEEEHWVNVLGTPSRRLDRLRVFDEFLQQHLGIKPGGTGDLS